MFALPVTAYPSVCIQPPSTSRTYFAVATALLCWERRFVTICLAMVATCSSHTASTATSTASCVDKSNVYQILSTHPCSMIDPNLFRSVSDFVLPTRNVRRFSGRTHDIEIEIVRFRSVRNGFGYSSPDIASIRARRARNRYIGTTR